MTLSGYFMSKNNTTSAILWCYVHCISASQPR